MKISTLDQGTLIILVVLVLAAAAWYAALNLRRVRKERIIQEERDNAFLSKLGAERLKQY
jgi:hypothetical protein